MASERVDWPVYFASREWALLKEQVRERSMGRCERCDDGAYEQTHHLNYKRPRQELVTDLMALCASCHEYLSGKRTTDPRRPITAEVNQSLAAGWFDSPFLQLHCPVCGFEYVHIEAPKLIDGGDDYKAWNGRGSAIDIRMWCERDHVFTLSLGFHKGGTFAFWRPNWSKDLVDAVIHHGSWDTNEWRVEKSA